MEKTEMPECEFKVLSVNDIKENAMKEETTAVFLTKERQEEIKKLMFSALEDPRAKYEPQTMDDLENYWKTRQGC
tara:strand:+ start:614 stop:838 length:225 start_codon:yes stop_codon:yes gene_type:complete